uniref:Uncharacterized protein n=1 Tax=Globodera rostochiensis TaxID=31243 RepID=A0A914HPI6_GLORO
MNEFWILILFAFFANSLDKAEAVKLELKTFDEYSEKAGGTITESDHTGQIESNAEGDRKQNRKIFGKRKNSN